MTEKHRHRTALWIAATELQLHGVIRTFDAVYRWTCTCGAIRRTTRLADTIYTLRHAYDWDISTHNEQGNLAVYTLVKIGDMPDDPSTGPHPRKLVRDWTPALSPATGKNPRVDEALKGVWLCTHCGAAYDETQIEQLPYAKRVLGGYWSARCTSEVCQGKEQRMFRSA